MPPPHRRGIPGRAHDRGPRGASPSFPARRRMPGRLPVRRLRCSRSRCEGPWGRRRVPPCMRGQAALPRRGRRGPALHCLEDPRGIANRLADDQLACKSRLDVADQRAFRGPLARRLQANEAVLRGGDADRATAVIGVRHGHHPRSDCCCRAAEEPPAEWAVFHGLRVGP